MAKNWVMAKGWAMGCRAPAGSNNVHLLSACCATHAVTTATAHLGDGDGDEPPMARHRLQPESRHTHEPAKRAAGSRLCTVIKWYRHNATRPAPGVRTCRDNNFKVAATDAAQVGHQVVHAQQPLPLS